jgi:hypothetical protein
LILGIYRTDTFLRERLRYFTIRPEQDKRLLNDPLQIAVCFPCLQSQLPAIDSVTFAAANPIDIALC